MRKSLASPLACSAVGASVAAGSAAAAVVGGMVSCGAEMGWLASPVPPVKKMNSQATPAHGYAQERGNHARSDQSVAQQLVHLHRDQLPWAREASRTPRRLSVVNAPIIAGCWLGWTITPVPQRVPRAGWRLHSAHEACDLPSWAARRARRRATERGLRPCARPTGLQGLKG